MTEESLDKLRELIEQAKRFVATSRKNWGRTATDPGPFVLHNSGDIQRFCSDLLRLQRLLEVMEQQCDAVELPKTESSFGDAYVVPVADDVDIELGTKHIGPIPERVAGSPVLLFDMQLHPSRASAEKVLEATKGGPSGLGPAIIMGNLPGIKELICSQIGRLWKSCGL
jgi:hypothetical protein